MSRKGLFAVKGTMKHVFLTLVLMGKAALACGTIPPNLWTLTLQAASQQGLEVELLGAVVWAESRYCADAVSPKGALGLGQLMPETALELGVDATDPAQNLAGSARYLREQWDRFGNVTLALAAYNAGPGTVKRYGGVPPYAETQAYVAKVLRSYQDFRVQTRPRKEGSRGLRVYSRHP